VVRVETCYKQMDHPWLRLFLLSAETLHLNMGARDRGGWASPEVACVTGHTLALDGGLTTY